MTARMSVEEAVRLGLVSPPRAKRTRREAKAEGPYRSRCHTCGLVIIGKAAEDRHVSRDHARFDVLEFVR